MGSCKCQLWLSPLRHLHLAIYKATECGNTSTVVARVGRAKCQRVWSFLSCLLKSFIVQCAPWRGLLWTPNHASVCVLHPLRSTTVLSKRIGAKFLDLSLNFPWLAVHWQAKLPGCTGVGIFKQDRGQFLCTTHPPCTYVSSVRDGTPSQRPRGSHSTFPHAICN